MSQCISNQFYRSVLDLGFVILRNLAGPTRRTEDKKFLPSMPGGDGEPNYSVIPRSFDADDRDPAQCARMSFEQMDSERTYEQDMKLNEYLLSNDHTSPFEMIQCWIEVRVPIFVDRQMVRHRTWSRNESSGRYIVLPDMWYIPDVVGGKAANKKQGQEDNLPLEVQSFFRQALNANCVTSYRQYTEFLDRGVAPEHARMFLHLNHYVHWIGSVNLGNLFKFLRLRDHSHAQIEAQMYARAIIELLDPHLPGLMNLYRRIVAQK